MRLSNLQSGYSSVEQHLASLKSLFFMLGILLLFGAWNVNAHAQESYKWDEILLNEHLDIEDQLHHFNFDQEIQGGLVCWAMIRKSYLGQNKIYIGGTDRADHFKVLKQGDRILVGLEDLETGQSYGACEFSQSDKKIVHLHIVADGENDIVDVIGDTSIYTEVYAGKGNDHVFVRGGGDCRVEGFDGNDFILHDGGYGSTLLGGKGRDYLKSTNGFWLPGPTVGMWGGPDDDLLVASGVGKQMRGEAGNDILRLEFGSIGCELYGDDGDDVLEGAEYDDGLYGGRGHDVLLGGDGNDLLDGFSGDDVLFGDRGNDLVDAGDGDDRLVGGLHEDMLIAGLGVDRVDAVDGFRDEIDKGDDFQVDAVAHDGIDYFLRTFVTYLDFSFGTKAYKLNLPPRTNFLPDMSWFQAQFPGL